MRRVLGIDRHIVNDHCIDAVVDGCPALSVVSALEYPEADIPPKENFIVARVDSQSNELVVCSVSLPISPTVYAS